MKRQLAIITSKNTSAAWACAFARPHCARREDALDRGFQRLVGLQRAQAPRADTRLCCISPPVTALNFSPLRCAGVPALGDAKFSLPGLRFSNATRSATDVQGAEALTTNTSGRMPSSEQQVL